MVTGAILPTVLVGAVAWAADNVVADGDAVLIGNQGLALGAVSCGVAKDGTATVRLSHQGGGSNENNIFEDGTSVKFSVQSTTPGLSATIGATDTVTLPGTWEDSSNGSLSNAVSSTVTVNSSTPGSGSGVVTYAATGTEATEAGGEALSRTGTLNVTWTTGSCAPSDTTAPTVSSINRA
jgi:hypothetical protein